MTKISAIVITKNEEINIERCLNSLQTVADEIIVVDSFSSDKTPEICLKNSAVRFEQVAWQGFSKTKNYANSLAQYDFILSLDADEELSPELQQEILNLKKKLSNEEAYYLNRMTNYCGRWIHHSGWMPDYQLRLFPRSGSQWNSAPVHEHIEFSREIKIQKLKGLLYHYSYYTLDEHLERMKNYTTLGAEKVLSQNENFLILKAIINPFLRFSKTFIFKRGFLDGYYGFALSIFAGFTVFLKYFKAWQMKKEKSTKNSI